MANSKVWPERHTVFLSRLYFIYIWKLVITGYRKALSPVDLWALDNGETASRVFDKLSTRYEALRQKNPIRKQNLFLACALIHRKLITIAVLVVCVEQLLAVLVVLCIKWLIELQTQLDAKPWQGPTYVVVMLISMAIKGLCLQHKDHMMNVVALRLRSALAACVFSKSLRLSPSARRQFSSGHITNLAQVDAAQCLEAFIFIQYLWAAPLMLLLAGVILYSVVGHATWAGIGVALLTFGVTNGVCAKYYNKLYTLQLTQKDERLRVLAEVLKMVKVIKLFAWEKAFTRLLERMRYQEVATIRKFYCFYAINDLTCFCTTLMVCLAVFITYTLGFQHFLTPEKAFIVIPVFSFLLAGMIKMPRVMMGVIAIAASFRRLEEFLCAEELVPFATELPLTEKNDMLMGACVGVAISIRSGNFTWDKSSGSLLKDINLDIPAKKLTAVIGPVGSGKSSLLGTITGDMYLGKMAYVPQQAWILNQTVRDNILFNTPYDEARYENVISACCLEPDFEILPAGDMTEIGERGINVSGGQKQRISLARAVYQQCEVYLLDDPLSAVDVHVQEHLFKRVIGPNGLLRDKTRVLVTHARAYLPQCDNIIVLDQGRVADCGTYDQIAKNRSDLVPASAESSERKMSKKQDASLERLEKIKATHDGKLVHDEGMSTGSVSARAYWAYFSAGHGLALVVLASVVLTIGCNTAAFIWLQISMESDNTSLPIDSNESFTQISTVNLQMVLALGTIVAIQVIFGLVYMISFALFSSWASKSLHSLLLKSILGSPLVFFNTTPLGRILNRFGQDINVIDTSLPHFVISFLKWGATIAFGIAAAIYATPIDAAVVAPGLVIVIVLQKLYIRTARQVQRLEAVSRSPLYSRMHDALQGPESIRIYNREETFVKVFHSALDDNTAPLLCQLTCARWLSVNLDFIASVIVAGTALVAMLMPDITPGLVGVSLSSIVTLTTFIIHVIHFACETEKAMVSVERIREYTVLKSEEMLHQMLVKLRKKSTAQRRQSQFSIISDKIRRFSMGRRMHEPKPPQFVGNIEFINYTLKYRPELPPVLQNITFQVGIVGRTGSGKSSLVSGLFRLVEPACGRILIDSFDISDIPLPDLRRQLTIIPQDPALFCGTVRQNLDPCGEYPDEKIWDALETSRLKSYVQSKGQGLDHELDCEGANLSFGQRQLICLARAILRRSRILVLDEATAFVDLETDKWIQAAIRTHFADCTVLTIAHRIDTIIDYDSVIVLRDGRISEHGSPKTLLANEESEFRRMVIKANIHVPLESVCTKL